MAAMSLLPDELLWSIFDRATLLDLVRAGLVCRRWRSIALKNRTYWANIILYDSPQKAARRADGELAIARLSRSSASPVDVHVVLYHTQPWIDDFVACVKNNLQRLRQLKLQLPDRYHPSLRVLVSATAPALLRLELAVPPAQWIKDRTLTRHLAHCLPQLRVLRLYLFTLHEDDREEFSNVEELCLGGSTNLMAELVVARFPNARSFMHSGRPIQFPAHEVLAGPVTKWLRGLKFLSLHKSSCSHIAGWDAIKEIASIHIENVTESMLDCLLLHFGEGEIVLDLRCRSTARDQLMEMYQPSTGLKRTVNIVDWIWLPDVPHLRVLGQQIVALSLPSGNWEEVFVAIGDPPQMRVLNVRLDETIGRTIQRCRGRVPSVYATGLQTLRFIGDAGIDTVDKGELKSFLDEFLILRGERKPVALEFRSLRWGDRLPVA